MLLRTVEVRNFRRVRSATVSFCRGVNVLHGPNDLGKSTIAEAIRAAFLIPVTSAEAKKFVPWNSDLVPFVRVVFDVGARTYQLSKAFAGARATSKLEEAAGTSFAVLAEGRLADDRVRTLLSWGLPALGGRGAKSSETWLTVALLGRQDRTTAILETSIAKDAVESGKELVTQALDALGQDPRVTQFIAVLEERLAPVFSEQGKVRRIEANPLADFRRRIEEKERLVSKLDAERVRNDKVSADVASARDRFDQLVLTVEQARTRLASARASEHRLLRRRALEVEVARIEKEAQRIQAEETEVAGIDLKLAELEPKFNQASLAAESSCDLLTAAEDTVSAARSVSESMRVKVESEKASAAETKARRRVEIEGAVGAAEQRLRLATDVLLAVRHAEDAGSRVKACQVEVDRETAEVARLAACVEQVRTAKHAGDVLAAEAGFANAERGLDAARAAVALAQHELGAADAALRSAEAARPPAAAGELQAAYARLMRAEIEERKATEWVRDATVLRERRRGEEVAQRALEDARGVHRNKAGQVEFLLSELRRVDEGAQSGPPNGSSADVPSSRISIAVALAVAVAVAGTIAAIFREPALAVGAGLACAAAAFLVARGAQTRRRKTERVAVLTAERRMMEEQVQRAHESLQRREEDFARAKRESAAVGLEGDPVNDLAVWTERLQAARREHAAVEDAIRRLEEQTGRAAQSATEEIEGCRAACDEAARALRNAQDALVAASATAAQKKAQLEGVRAAGGSTPTDPAAAHGNQDELELRAGQRRLEDARRQFDGQKALWDHAQATAARLTAELPEPGEVYAKRAKKEKAEAEEALSSLDAAPPSSALASESVNAEAALANAIGRQESARLASAEAQGRVAELSREIERLRVERETRVRNLETMDKVSCHHALADARRQLDELPQGSAFALTTAEAEAQFAGVEAQMRREEEGLHGLQGQLQLLGGAAMSERCTAEREVLERLKLDAADAEEEFESQRLLLETLKQRDASRVSHLGSILAGPVTERFVALTGSRYQQVRLQPGLQNDGVVSRGERRDVDDLSVGTRDQLSTLLRVIVASVLKTVIVLDDQLVQTDPARMRWFLDEFQRVALAGTQVVILTCRPEEYASPSASAADSAFEAQSRVVDLNRLVVSDDAA